MLEFFAQDWMHVGMRATTSWMKEWRSATDQEHDANCGGSIAEPASCICSAFSASQRDRCVSDHVQMCRLR